MLDPNRLGAVLLAAVAGLQGVKWVDTCGLKRSKYQRFREGINPGRPEEAYEVCLSHREVSLSSVVMIYKLI